MRSSSPLSTALAVTLLLLQPCGGIAQSAARGDGGVPVIIGFLGGFVHIDDRRHSEVQLADRLRVAYGKDAHIEIFRNRAKADAYLRIMSLIDSNHDGKLSEAEKQAAHIILFGHSWGASAVVSLARELERDGIPVLMTIQVDSISKNQEEDSIIPANVVQAINFYQTGGLLHGRSAIRAADPSRTRILGNFHLQYKKEPLECRAYQWYNRLLFKGHTSIECDPRVWSEIQALIRAQLLPVLPAATDDDMFLSTANVTSGPVRDTSFIFSTPPATIPPLNLLAPTTRAR